MAAIVPTPTPAPGANTGAPFELDHAGATLAGLRWGAAPRDRVDADSEPRRVLLIVHGLGEHIGRYGHLADYFARAGYVVYGVDHQGHGRSAGARGCIASWDSLVAELNTLRGHAEQCEGQAVSTYLWAHSLGGLIALDYLAHRPEAATLAGAVVTAPPLRVVDEPPAAVRALAPYLARLAPNLTQGNGIDARDLSRDPGVVSLYTVDPLNHDRVSMRLGAGLLAAQTRLAGRVTIPVPTLLLHGGEDAICDVAGSRRFAAGAHGPVEFRVFDGLRHEIHNEPEQAEVFAFAKTWLDARA